MLKSLKQQLDRESSQFIIADRLTELRNQFRLNARRLYVLNEGISKWRTDDYTGLFSKNVYTTCPFEDKVYRSKKINIWNDSNKIKVGKSGLYRVNVNWLVGIDDPNSTKATSMDLYLSKNGSTTPSSDFILMQALGLYSGCTGAVLCEYYEPLVSLQGTTEIWIDTTDYIEIKLMPYSTLDINTPDTHDGYLTVEYITNNVEII